MPRKARITVAGAVHHIMSRGNEGRDIFLTDDDRFYFLRILEKRIIHAGYLLYAWCLMSNHYHVVVRINNYPLGSFMRLLNSQFAQYIRKREGTRGHLFQDRYKSIVTHDQNYIQELIRYVHLNPLRAGVCRTLSGLDNYRWCGHSVLLGRHSLSCQCLGDVLNRFGTTPQMKRKMYHTFIKDGINNNPDIHELVRAANQERQNIHNTGCWVIGNREFVVKVLNEQKKKNLGIPFYVQSGITLDDIAQKVCKTVKITCSGLKIRGRKTTVSQTRKRFAFTAHRKYQFPVVDIASYLGIRPQSVSQLIRLGEALSD